MFANGTELKNLMHQRGINLKYLPMVYSEVTNKSVKRYIHTFMVAKIAKDYILQELSEAKKRSSKTTSRDVAESLIKLMVEGSSHTSD